MSLYRTLIGGVIAVGLAASPAWADRPRDQDRAFKATREGRSMPLPQIERRVMPFMGGAEYLGPEFMGKSYRLKFMRDGRVIWVDVDAATGRISAMAPRVNLRKSSSERLASAWSRSHSRGRTSAIRPAEKSDWLIASCRLRASFCRSSRTASSCAWRLSSVLTMVIAAWFATLNARSA